MFREAGIELTAAEIVWLANLRRACDDPHDGSVPWVMGAPVEFSGVKFWPLHRLAESWYVRAMQIVGPDDRLQGGVYLYAHAHSAPGDKHLRDLTSYDAIKTAILEWLDTVPLHTNVAQLEALCRRLSVLDGDDDAVPDPEPKPRHEPVYDNLPRFVSVACRAFSGVSPDFWLTEMPAAAVRSMISDACGDGDGWATSETRRAAIANWLRAIKWIWKLHENG